MGKQQLLIISLLMACVLTTGCTASADQRTGEAQGYGGVLRVTVSMNGTDVTKVQVTEHHETEGVGTRAIDALPDMIVKADSADVDGVSGATVTSNAIREAVRQAMGGAAFPDSVTIVEDAAQSPATSSGTRSGVGMAATGRMGPGTAEDGSAIHSVNIVFAAGVFDEDGRILHMDVDQLEIASPNMAEGNVFSGFPSEDGTQEDFLSEVKSWVTKGALGEDYRMPSGTWREQMDAYQQHFIGKTVDEVESWFQRYFDPETGRPLKEGDAWNALSDEDKQIAADITASATMTLRGEHGDILTAVRRAWEDAQRDAATATGSADSTDTPTTTDATLTDTASPTDGMSDDATVG